MFASLLGTRLTLYIGPVIAVPAPESMMEALSSVEVTQNSEGRDGFQITFTMGRGPLDIVDYQLLLNPLIRPFNRVVIQVWLGVQPEVLIDGFITNYQISPSNEPGASTLTVTGEDVRVMMDLYQFTIPYPMMTPEMRVAIILAKYIQYLAMPPVIWPSPFPDPPLPTDSPPTQSGTDYNYLMALAGEASYVFYIEPTPVPMVNLAYWGMENRLSLPQPALTVNMGQATNVNQINFSYNALGPQLTLGLMVEKNTSATIPIATFMALHPPLAAIPALVAQLPYVRTMLPSETGDRNPMEAYARAQAETNRSADAITATGELDTARYGHVLKARRSVGVRGAGYLMDGFWFVKRVTHSIKKGSYTQSFSLARDGFGSLTPIVMP